MLPRSKDNLRRGNLIATVLSGSWRDSDLTPLAISETELDEVTPLLCISGAAALAWLRISKSHLKDSLSAEVLHQAYRLQSLQATLHEQKVEKVFRLLRQASVDAIMAKGWAAARFYYQSDLRPSGDIDICIRPGQVELAEKVLCSPEANDCSIDWHRRFYEIDERGFDELFARSILVPLGEQNIRTLGNEDHLALLCIHLLKHGAWRPLWLCDISAAIESLPANFDWEVCLGTSSTRSSWILCALKLAGRLLGADTTNSPVSSKDIELPAWLVQNVRKHWSNPLPMNQPPMCHPIPMVELLRHPNGLLEGIRQRWPDPILATISVNGDFNNLPRLPYQIANWATRLKRFLVNRSSDWQED